VLSVAALLVWSGASHAEVGEPGSRERAESAAAEAVGGGEGMDLLDAPGLSRGVDSIIAQIREREMSLSLREQKVAERERAVVELEQLLEERAHRLDRIRLEIEDRIAAWVSQGPDRVTQLSDVYASMPPAKAGQLLGNLDLDLAVSIVRGMKKKSSAGVLSAMRPDRALRISQRMLRPLDPATDAPAARAN
jgi:flagellar motility protein MotE (MotC chaperone)